MLYTPLFKKYQKSLLWLANSPGGREILGIPFGARNIVKIDKNSFTEILFVENNKSIFRQTFYTKNKHLLVLRNNMTFDYLEMLDKNKHEKFGERVVLGNLDPFDKSVVGKYPIINFTTTDFNPDSDPESTSVDGYTGTESDSVSWSSLVNGNGTFANDAVTQDNDLFFCRTGTSTNNWDTIRRGFFLFDTSSLTDLAEIESATFSLYFTTKQANFNLDFALTDSNPASNTALVASDYQNGKGSTKQSDTTISTSGISTGSYNDWLLNSTGLGNIAKTGVTKLGTRSTQDIDNSPISYPGNNITMDAINDFAGGSNEPKLTVTFTLPVKGSSTLGFFIH